MRRIVAFAPSLLVLAAVVAVLVGVPRVIRRAGDSAAAARVVLARQVADQSSVLEQINVAVRAVADSVMPSVTHIEAFTPGESRFASRAASGAGWVFDADGHVVTNAHVVRGAERIRVEFADGRVSSARLVGADPYTDVAVLAVGDPAGIIPARRASGDDPRVGDRVFAFGSPFGFSFSMTEGIISGLGRDAHTALEFGGYTNFIQTDAAVNPGHSGGPLVDVRGRVIGMNVAIATGRDNQGTTEGQSAGISFAIPLATIESVVSQIVATGSVSRGFLGIVFNPNDEREDPDAEGFPWRGVRIERVERDGPAHRAGLRAGDIIVEVNGRRIPSGGVLRSVISVVPPGEEVRVRYWRDGSTGDATVVLGEMPRAQLDAEVVPRAIIEYGMMLRQDPEQGPTVSFVLENSPAARDGFAVGQVVTHVGDRAVSGLDDLLEALVAERFVERGVVGVRVRGPDDGQTASLTIRLRR